MNKELEIKNNLEDKRQLIERIEKLEFALVLVINQLRILKEFPPNLLNQIEKLLLTRIQ